MSQQGTLDQLLAALKSVDAFKLKARNAKTREELNAAQAGLARITNSIAQKYPEFDKDLSATFRASYLESGGTGTPPKNYSQKSYASRQKAKKGFEKASTSLRLWGDDYTRDRAISNARAGYREQLVKLGRTGGTKEQLAAVKAKIDALPKPLDVSSTPSVVYNSKTKEGLRRTHVPADQYMRMATNSAYAIQRNMGVLAAASAKSGWVIVSDGPGCGRGSHGDSQKANGEVWSVEEAFSHPIAHPNCTRSFSVSPGPPGSKKTKDRLKELGLVPQRTSKKNTLEGIAKAAAAAGFVASIGGTIVQNPFIRRYMRELIEDTNISLSPAAQRIINRLQTYSVRESRAFERFGPELKAGTQQQFDDIVANSFDDDFANEEFLVRASSERLRISQVQARVLGLSTRPTKGELLAKLDDYGDYLIHKDSLRKSIDERIQDAVNFSHANEELHRTAALKFHIEPGQGLNVDRNWYNIVRKLKHTYNINPEKADRDLIRLAAGVLDPTPWLRANLTENVRFTLGLTSRGRQNIAVKLYDKMKGGRSLTLVEKRWAEELGMDMAKFTEAESITVQDIVNALTPRITYQPGGLFSGTLALRNGKLQPIIRLYPHGSFGRLISLESKLRAGAIEDFIATMRKHDLPMNERWVEALNTVATEDLITSLRLFRNSPLQLSLRMVGATPDSWAIRALPDNNYLRYSYRFTLDFKQRSALQLEVRNRLLAGESVEDILKGMVTPSKDLKEFRTQQKEARALVRKEAAAIAKKNVDDWLEGVTVLPNFAGGFSLAGLSISQREALIKLKLLGNNLLTISKRTRYGYDNLLEMWAEFKTTTKDFVTTVGSKRVLNIRSFKDATELIGDALRTKASIIDGLHGEDLTKVNLSFASRAAELNDGLRDDLARFKLAWQQQFPQIPVPDVEVVANLRTPLSAEPGVIFIREDIARDWEVLGSLRRKAVRIGHFPRDTDATVANLIHEGAHSVLLQMEPSQLKKLIVAAIKSQKWPVPMDKMEFAELPFIQAAFRKDAMIKRVARSVSGYASTSIDEMLAEALSEYFTSNNPRPLARAVGQAFVATLTV